MKIRAAHQLAAAMACVGFLVPPSAFASSPAAPVADVELADGGVFAGKVVDVQGAPVANTEVSIRTGGAEVATAITNEAGEFAASGLRGGQYMIVAEEGAVVYRLWSPGTAPPAANTAALIVTGGDVLRGQYAPYGHGGGGGILQWMRNHPLLVGAGVAAAIAIPIAVADDDDPAST